jgi:Barstar (barnase inhibitor)
MKLLRRAVSLAEVRGEHPQVRVVAGAGSKREAIAEFYRAVEAPSWAAPNLDGLADVLNDLSWLPTGEITLAWVAAARCPMSRAGRLPGCSRTLPRNPRALRAR